MNNKPRIVFIYVKAGYGHIAPMKAIHDAFVRFYHNQFEILSVYPLKDQSNPRLNKLGHMLEHSTNVANRYPVLGYGLCLLQKILPLRFVYYVMAKPKTRKAVVDLLKSYHADALVSTHWLTHYLASFIQDEYPINIAYVPDAHVLTLETAPSDLTIVSYDTCYQEALRKHPKRFNINNLALSSFPIRKEIANTNLDKTKARELLHLPIDNFTLIFMDGSYGSKKTRKVIKKLLLSNMKLTIISIAGSHQSQSDYFKTLKVNPNITFLSLGKVDNVGPYLAASDVFLGKGGASSLAEAHYFHLPMIITRYTFSQEKKNTTFYPNAFNIKHVRQIIKFIKNLYQNSNKLTELSNRRSTLRYGAEEVAQIIYQKIIKNIKK